MKKYNWFAGMFMGFIFFIHPGGHNKELHTKCVESQEVCDLGTKVYVQNSDSVNRYKVTVKWKNEDIQGSGTFVVYVPAKGSAYAGCTYITGDKSGHRSYSVVSEKAY